MLLTLPRSSRVLSIPMTHQKETQTSRFENATRWEIDPLHSTVDFSVRHMMFATVRGGFKSLQAIVHLDEEDPSRSIVEAEIDATSIDTGVNDRDDHLRSADFLDAEHHPKLKFRSTHVEPQGEGRARVIGRLTIRGVTQPFELQVTREGTGTDPWGNTRTAYSATGTLERSAFGLTWNQALETGGLLVGDKIKIQIEVQSVKQDPNA